MKIRVPVGLIGPVSWMRIEEIGDPTPCEPYQE